MDVVAQKFAAARAEGRNIPKDEVPTVPSLVLPDPRDSAALAQRFDANRADHQEAAYEVQAEMIKQGLLGGLKGWKVGAATPAAQEKLGIAEPFRGPIFANYVKESGAKVPWSQVGCVLSAVEVEFCFVMASSLPPRDTPYTEDEVWGAVGHVTTAIEMAAQRSTAIAPLSKETLGPAVADCAVNGLVVLGGAVPLAAVDRAALPQLPATLAVTPAGGAAARAAGAGDNVLPFGPKGSGVLVGPLASLTWLANHLAETLAGLRAGELVISGAAGLLKKPDCDVGMACTVEASASFAPGSPPACLLRRCVR